MSTRTRIDALEQRLAGYAVPCDACRDGTRPVVSYRNDGDADPEPPPPCPACGRPRLHIVVTYTRARTTEGL